MRGLCVIPVLFLLACSDGGSSIEQPGIAELSVDEQGVLAEINRQRTMRGLSAVVLRDDLVCAAQHHSADIGERQACTHDSENGDGPGDRVESCGGAGWSGEIVACGHGTPEAAVQGWIDSPGHNAIMFDPDQKRVGVAMHNHFWTAIFDKSE